MIRWESDLTQCLHSSHSCRRTSPRFQRTRKLLRVKPHRQVLFAWTCLQALINWSMSRGIQTSWAKPWCNIWEQTWKTFRSLLGTLTRMPLAQTEQAAHLTTQLVDRAPTRVATRLSLAYRVSQICPTVPFTMCRDYSGRKKARTFTMLWPCRSEMVSLKRFKIRL